MRTQPSFACAVTNASTDRATRVLRIYHSAVVGAWRERDRQLRGRGIDLNTIAPRRWNEGGRDVALEAKEDAVFVVPARTVGRHPYVFVYNPLPLLRELRRHPDLVDVHEEPASLAALEIMMLMAVTRSKAKLVFYGAQNLDKRFPMPFRWIESLALRRADGVHVCNVRAGELFVKRGLRGEVCLLGLGVDVDRFHPSTRGRSSGSSIMFGYVGRLEQHKGVHIVIEAMSRLEDAQLTIVGDGPMTPSLQDQIVRLGLEARVTVHGFCPPDEVAEVYRSFDVLVVPSLDTPSWVEQFGRVAVEAMACGVPVIASNSGALPDVVGAAGLLVTPGSVDAWVDAMNAVAADPARREKMRDDGIAHAGQYRWSEIARRQLEFYETVLASRHDPVTSSSLPTKALSIFRRACVRCRVGCG